MSADLFPLRSTIEMRRASGLREAGEIVTRRDVGSRFVLGVRFADGQVESLVIDSIDHEGERVPCGAADNAHGLAAAILAGTSVRLPIGEQLQILASAVLGTPAERDGRAA